MSTAPEPAAPGNAPRSGASRPQLPDSPRSETRVEGLRVTGKDWDPRVAARQYSQILGAAAGFIVTAVVLVFTVAPARAAEAKAELSLAAGLLVLALLGSLLGAFGFASLGAETRITGNLSAAVMWLGAPVLIAVIAILAAFEVLASIFLPDSTTLFAMITAGAATAGVVFTMLGVADDFGYIDAPPSPGATRWLRSHRQAEAWAVALAGTGLVIVWTGTALYFAGVRIDMPQRGVTVLISTGIALTVVCALWGVMRAVVRANSMERPMQMWEAITVQAMTSVYLALLIMCLP